MRVHALTKVSFLLALFFAFPFGVQAATTINTVTVNGGATVTVNPADPTTVSVTVSTTLTDLSDWESTSWDWVSDGNPEVCVNTSDETTAGGPFSKTFSIPVPSEAGTYDLVIRAYGTPGNGGPSTDNTCGTSADDTLTLNNALIRVTRQTVSATLNGAPTATVAPGASIATVVTGNITGGGDGDWDGTRWRFSTTPPGSTTCANTPDSNSAGTFAKSFTTTAPAVPGVYNAYFMVDGNDLCLFGQGGTLLTMANALTVVTPGTIIVDKVTDPAGDAQSFSFTTTGGTYAGFALTDSDVPNAQLLAPGAYSVSETATAGWVQTSAACVSSISDTETPGAIELDAGETVTCTFTNTKLGSLTTQIATDPDSTGQAFNFTSAPFGGAFALTDNTGTDEGMQVGSLAAGTYSIATTSVPAGWVFNSFTCDSGETDHLAINLTPGENVVCTANYTKLATFSLTKYTDPAIGSYEFMLAGPQTATTTLTPAGSWNLIDLIPGSYTLSETIIVLPDTDPAWVHQAACNGIYSDPAGPLVTATLSTNLPAGEAMSCIVNNTQKSVISGKKFEDMDGVGSGVTGPGLIGWEISVRRLNDDPLTDGVDESVTQPITVTNTNGTGDYSFLLNPGMYRVCESPEPNWYQSVPSTNVGCSGFQNGYMVTVTAGQVLTGQDFGNFRKGTISGTKWQDDDLDGTINGTEIGLNGWSIKAYDTSWVGAATDVTAAGTYTLSLDPGTYYVTEIMQDGWAQTYPSYPADMYHTVTVTSNAVIVGKNFGNVPDATIFGTKFEDVNSDGVINGLDAPLLTTSFMMTLYKSDVDGNLVQLLGSTSTNPANGAYTFTGLIPGYYKVIEQPVSGWLQTAPTAGVGQLVNITAVNQDAVGYDFLNTRTSIIYGIKWSDIDRDGTKAVTEVGVGGVMITATPVTDMTGATIDTNRSIKTTTTISTGAYQFDFVNGENGYWKITETVPSGYLQTYPTVNNGAHIVEVTTNSVTELHFGNWEKPYVTVEKWKDDNNNGIREWNDTLGVIPGVKEFDEPYTEGPVSAWPFYLARFVATSTDLTHVQVFETNSTNAAGTTTLRTLEPGEYYVFEGVQGSWSPTYPEIRSEAVNVTFGNSIATTSLVINRYYTFTVAATGATGGMTITMGSSTAATTSAITFGNYSIPAPVTPTPSGGGGGNGPISGTFGGVNGTLGSGGLVLGVSTSTNSGNGLGTTPPPTGLGAACERYITEAVGPGRTNNSVQVSRVQYVLKTFEGADVEVNGLFDTKTLAAVRAFQQKYASEILAPWGLTRPTGVVYLTTRKKMNEIYCNNGIPLPLTRAEQQLIDSFRNRGGGTGGTESSLRRSPQSPSGNPQMTVTLDQGTSEGGAEAGTSTNMQSPLRTLRSWIGSWFGSSATSTQQ